MASDSPTHGFVLPSRADPTRNYERWMVPSVAVVFFFLLHSALHRRSVPFARMTSVGFTSNGKGQIAPVLVRRALLGVRMFAARSWSLGQRTRPAAPQ